MLTPIDDQLKRSAPPAAAPEGLHRLIMDSVRAADTTLPERRRIPDVRIVVAVGAVLTLVCAGLFMAGHWSAEPPGTTPGPGALAAAESALSLGDRLSRAAPAALVSPMERELELIGRDLESTSRLLLASLP